MVGQRFLEPLIGVRVPDPELEFWYNFKMNDKASKRRFVAFVKIIGWWFFSHSPVDSFASNN
jgi:hypothetical protein